MSNAPESKTQETSADNKKNMRVPGVLALLYLIPTGKQRALSLPYHFILTPNSYRPTVLRTTLILGHVAALRINVGPEDHVGCRVQRIM